MMRYTNGQMLLKTQAMEAMAIAMEGGISGDDLARSLQILMMQQAFTSEGFGALIKAARFAINHYQSRPQNEPANLEADTIAKNTVLTLVK